ncbi:MAG: CHRD domain-containing protein [bacterium]|nr:CHRD domain-containing protein [bacterium]
MRRIKHTVLVAAATCLALGLGAGDARADLAIYTTALTGASEVPPNASPAVGIATLTVDTETLIGTYTLQFSGLTSAQTAVHFHTAAAGVNGPVAFGLPLGSPIAGTWNLTAPQYASLVAGSIYLNVHSTTFPGGEIRGQMTLDHVVAGEEMTFGGIKTLFQ